MWGYSCYDGRLNNVLLCSPGEHRWATLYPNLTLREKGTLLKACGIDGAGRADQKPDCPPGVPGGRLR